MHKFFWYERTPTGGWQPVLAPNRPSLDKHGRLSLSGSQGPYVRRVTELRDDDPRDLTILPRLYPFQHEG